MIPPGYSLVRRALFVASFTLAGPLLAFLVALLGCSGQDPLLAEGCGHNILTTWIGLTIVAWLVLLTVKAARDIVRGKE